MSIENLISHLKNTPPSFPIIFDDSPAIEKYIHLERGKNGTPRLAFLPENSTQLHEIILLLNQHHANAVIFAGNTGLVSAQRATDNAVIDLQHFSQLHSLHFDDGDYFSFSPLAPDLLPTKKAEIWQQELLQWWSDKNAAHSLSNVTITSDAAVHLGTINHIIKPLGLEIPLNTGAVQFGAGMTIGGGIANATHGGYGLLHGTLCDLVAEVHAINGDGSQRCDLGIPFTPHHTNKNHTAINSARAQYGDSALGTQGTFSIITHASLHLFPIPAQSHYFLTKVKNFNEINKLRHLLQQNYPSNLRQFEVMNQFSLELVRRYEKDNYLNPFLDTSGAAVGNHSPIDSPYVLLIELIDFNKKSDLGFNAYDTITTLGYDDTQLAYAGHEANDPEAFMRLRHAISGSSTRYASTLGTPTQHRVTPDISVPLTHLEPFTNQLLATLEKEGCECALFGHIGIGALHLHAFTKKSLSSNEKQSLIENIYSIISNFNGSCWSEHGIGTANAALYANYTPSSYVEEWLGYVKKYDPNNVLNPHSNNFSAYFPAPKTNEKVNI